MSDPRWDVVRQWIASEEGGAPEWVKAPKPSAVLAHLRALQQEHEAALADLETVRRMHAQMCEVAIERHRQVEAMREALEAIASESVNGSVYWPRLSRGDMWNTARAALAAIQPTEGSAE